jgi:hypothetical protein
LLFVGHAATHSPRPPKRKRPGLSRRSRKGAGSKANRFSPSRLLFFEANSAPRLGQIQPVESVAVPGVRIHPSPPSSLACFPTFWRSDEIGARGAIHARSWTRRMPTAPVDCKNRSKFSVRDFGMSICEPADILWEPGTWMGRTPDASNSAA